MTNTQKLFHRISRRDPLFSLIIGLLTLFTLMIPTGFTSPYPKGSSAWVKARIIETNNSLVKTIGPIKEGAQQLEIRIMTGKFKGRTLAATNLLMGKLELDKFFSPGDTAFVVLDLSPDGTEIIHPNVIDHYRLDATILLMAAFSLVLILFARWTGLKALLSFVFSGAVIIKLLLPAILRGVDPLLITFAVVALLTFVIIFLVGGFTQKGLTAFVGSMGGVAITSVLAILFTSLFKIHGAVRPFTETLLYQGFDFLNLPHLFMAGIFLASSGAVMDLSMDIAAAMDEVRQKHPAISRADLIRSGFTVGRQVVGTMTTTLLLAYTGGYTALMMTFMSQGIPPANIINMIYVSAELVHTMVGSFGLVLVAPVTALAGGFILVQHQHKG
ncbi:MAG: YibE/F family protein [Treponema sp.]|nr:YibE/F family protein [Treponema sp.]